MSNRGGPLLEVTSQSAIDHILRVNPKKVQRLSFANPLEKLSARQKDLAAIARTNRIPTEFGARMSQPGEGISAQVSPYVHKDLKETLSATKDKKHSIILVLDHIQDTQNFGALARSAEAFGIDAVILPKDRSVQITGGVYNTSVGAVESLSVIQVANIAETLKRLKENEYWIVGSSLGESAKPLQEVPTFERIALVLGSELDGMSSHVESACDWLVKIPMLGKIDSLNVSASGAILMHFFATRR